MPSDNKIIFEFICNGESLLLDDSLFSVLDYSGIESTDYELITVDNVNSDGSRKKKRRVLPRQIMVEFDYLRWSDIPKYRQKLIRFFTPYSSGTLNVTYCGTTRTIEYELDSFKINNKNVHDELSALVYVNCLDPSFKSPSVYGKSIMTLVGGWKWPFTLPFKLKQYGDLKKNILNPGDVETPVEIYFRGPAASPRIINHRTGEYIQITRDLAESETLYINTGGVVPEIEIQTEDSIEDGWSYVDPSSIFWMLEPGDNMIEYSAGSLRSKGVEVFYRARYLGI